MKVTVKGYETSTRNLEKTVYVKASMKTVFAKFRDYPCTGYPDTENVVVNFHNEKQALEIIELLQELEENSYYYLVVKQNNNWHEVQWDGKKWAENNGKLYKTLQGACNVAGFSKKRAHEKGFKLTAYGQPFIVRVCK